MSLKRFNEILHKLEEDQRNQKLEYAIRSWYRELNLDRTIGLDYEKIKSYIEEWKNEYKILIIYHNIGSVVWGEISSWPSKLLGNNQKLEINKNYTGLIEKMNIKYIILIAFIFAGVGVALYLSDQNHKKSKRDRTSTPQRDYSSTYPSLSPRQSPQKNILILVINAKNNEGLIQSLNSEKPVPSTILENIYRSTKVLWIGNQEDFDDSGLNHPFSQAETSQPFDYDVYFVKIELDKYVRGFKENADALERADAFERLTQTKHEVKETSKRLSIESAHNPHLYR